MRLAKTTTLIAVLLAALLGGCGSSGDKGKPIPAATKAELDKQLTSIQARFKFGDGACSNIAENQQSVQKTIDSLPSDTDADVKKALTDGFNRLFQLTDEQCDANKNQKTETQTQETQSAPEPTPTETQTEQSTTPTTPTNTTPTKTTPKAKGNGNGNGNGNGGGGAQGGQGGGVTAPGGDLP